MNVSLKLNKYISVILLFLIIVTDFYAFSQEIKQQEDENYIYMQLKGGETVKYNFNTRPVILFTNNRINIGIDSYEFTDVEKYTFREPSGESSIAPIDCDNFFTFADGKVRIKSITNPETIHITDIQGINYFAKDLVTNSEGFINVDLTILPIGTYILWVENHSIKFVKK